MLFDLVAAPLYGCVEVGMCREKIYNFDILRLTLQDICAHPPPPLPYPLVGLPKRVAVGLV